MYGSLGKCKILLLATGLDRSNKNKALNGEKGKGIGFLLRLFLFSVAIMIPYIIPTSYKRVLSCVSIKKWAKLLITAMPGGYSILSIHLPLRNRQKHRKRHIGNSYPGCSKPVGAPQL